MKIVALTKRLFVNACLKPAENETESDEGDGQHRETWTGKFDFFLSALGYAGMLFSPLDIYFNYIQDTLRN